MKITKTELLKRLEASLPGQFLGGPERWPYHIAEKVAEVLGYEVVEEPELPERLVAQCPFGCRYWIGEGEPGAAQWRPLLELTANDSSVCDSGAALSAELVRRYNARRKVIDATWRLRAWFCYGGVKGADEEVLALADDIERAYKGREEKG